MKITPINYQVTELWRYITRIEYRWQKSFISQIRIQKRWAYCESIFVSFSYEHYSWDDWFFCPHHKKRRRARVNCVKWANVKFHSVSIRHIYIFYFTIQHPRNDYTLCLYEYKVINNHRIIEVRYKSSSESWWNFYVVSRFVNRDQWK